MDREDFRIQHRHLSEEQWRDAYCRKTGTDRHDLDSQIWREREERNRYYSEMDDL
jgi:hypothetical protein